jgi:hypothetical protein
MKGQIISGEYGEIIARKKSDQNIEIGELLIAENNGIKMLLQVIGLEYGSQISRQNLELISGMRLEEDDKNELFEENLRLYTLVKMKTLLTLEGKNGKLPKSLPEMFSGIKEVTKEDLYFLTKPKNPLFVGKLRSGSRSIDADIYLDGMNAFSHHILIPATTGRGKSNLISCMLLDSIGKDYCGILVLDPHDEYYGRNSLGLKDHPLKENLIYYTAKDVPSGQRSLKINIDQLRPTHFNGVVEWTQAQSEALSTYYKRYGEKWVEAIILEKPVDGFQEGTISVLKRRILHLLDLSFENNRLVCGGVFQTNGGISTLGDICNDIESGKVVIIDTSEFSGSVEILIGSLVANEIFRRYKNYKMNGQIDKKPVISIVLEEAPRVIGKEALEKGPNIFSTIAREGRKFKVGLTAITQLPSLIPRQILANMNTKIVLGIEMQAERQAIIESASQDLSDDNKTIASLDIGEAIITSNFTRFAIPVKIPFFDDMVKELQNKHVAEKYKNNFSGIKN